MEDTQQSKQQEPSGMEMSFDDSENVPADETEKFKEDEGTETADIFKTTVIESASDSKDNGEDDEPKQRYNLFQRESMRVARNPCTYFWVSFLSALLLGVIGMVAGNFSVSADNAGWNSRGTLIANRHTQYQLVETFHAELHGDTTDQVWTDLITNVQQGWETDDDAEDSRRLAMERIVASRNGGGSSFDAVTLNDLDTLGERLQQGLQMKPMRAMQEAHDWFTPSPSSSASRRATLPRLTKEQVRLLNTLNSTQGTLLEGCDTSWYMSERMTEDTHLWPIWRAKASTASFFDWELVQEQCLEEETTQSWLEQQGHCIQCTGSSNDNRCLQPYSPVFYARLTVTNGMTLSCQDLAAAWRDEGHDEAHKTSLADCVDDLLTNYNVEDGSNMPDSCPYGFYPSILDELYSETTQRAEYSSTIFATKWTSVDAMYDHADSFPKGRTYIKGAYDTQYEDFVNLSLDDQLIIDMSLAVGSAFVTCIAMVIHTRSPFLMVVGLAQIVMSFPLAFFFYTFVARLEFFPFLNFIGIFVLFALGADDVFVAVDKWKNARIKNPNASTEAIAAIAMPDAASAMLLTTLTTAVAFFGTAVCPVAPILCFAVFCGLLVIFDYMLCCLLVFPALCIYDQADHENRCCCHCKMFSNCKHCKKQGTGDNTDEMLEQQPSREDGVGPDEPKSQVIGDDLQDEKGDEVETQRNKQQQQTAALSEPQKEDSLIHSILRTFFKYLVIVRWPLLLVCAASLVVCAIKASQIELPISADVRLYDEEDNQYEQNFVWRKKLLSDVLEKKGGSTAYVIWGVKAADTGDHNDPDTWSQLVLDNSFEPSNTEAQAYLLDFCDSLLEQDFASKTSDDFVCPLNSFDSWLKNQSSTENPSATYQNHCNGASEIPMAEGDFDQCIYNWGQDVNEYRVLARHGKVEIIYFGFNSRVRYDSPFSDLDDEWHLIEDWMDAENAKAPPSASRAYFTSEDFWWYDTNGSMLNTAFQSAGIAMAAAAAVVLFSSRSVVLTLFSTLTVGYVLTSVTAMLVAMGWSLGFIESILFAILIGISCDFVIHFSHAYAHLKGHRSREERTLHALLSMGPSILAAGFTTFSAALVMLFTVITFFEKFAVILFLTVLQALVGSFVVFLTMAVCLGPSDPTYLVDHMLAKCCPLICGKQFEIQGDQEEDDDVTGVDNEMSGEQKEG